MDKLTPYGLVAIGGVCFLIGAYLLLGLLSSVEGAQLAAYSTAISAYFAAFTVLATSVYVFYTVKTFIEIRKQTELQSKSLLFISSYEEKDPLNESIKGFVQPESEKLYDRWKTIIANHLSPDMVSESNLILSLKNRGKSDITKVEITMYCSVISTDNLTKLNTQGEDVSWKITIDKSFIIMPNEEVVICVAKTGGYPKAIFSWDVLYFDTQGNKQEHLIGERERVVENLFIAGYSETNSSQKQTV